MESGRIFQATINIETLLCFSTPKDRPNLQSQSRKNTHRQTFIMSMVIVRFTRLPTPPLTVNAGNAHDYEPWYEAIQIIWNSSGNKAWEALSTNTLSSIHNHYRDYKY
ncbi:hypothetical protein BTUL_0012g00340 [Botrytis tulipae]|uniref:Uncharacterized protein n=1 Tax=Botrytis tulipae TaxID=87230 RepID=A0A4Z1F335_9HELO|nr:hypothetical protein BTUL_0012g00340 [Botrytis tulipae]